MQFSDKRKLQEEQYNLPYHYIPTNDKGWLEYNSLLKQVILEIERLNIKQNVLDCGCGDGRLSYELAKRGFKITGIDISERALAFAKIFVPDGRFFREDITKPSKRFLEKNKRKFDLALFIETLEHIPPKHHMRALRNIHTLLSDSGFLILSVPSILMPLPQKHYKHFSVKEIIKLLTRANFIVEKIEGNHCNSSLDLLLKIVDNRFYCLKPLKRVIYMGLKRKYINCPLKKAKRYVIVATKQKKQKRGLN